MVKYTRCSIQYSSVVICKRRKYFDSKMRNQIMKNRFFDTHMLSAHQGMIDSMPSYFRDVLMTNDV